MALAAVGLTACGRPWVVLSQGPPGALAGQRNFVVMPLDFRAVRVGDQSEVQWLGEQDSDERNDWAEDKGGMNTAFAMELMETAADEGIRVGPPSERARFVIHPQVDWVRPGLYAYFIQVPTEIRMTVRITAADGQIIDEILLHHITQATLINPSQAGRMRDTAETLGGWVADYVASRVYLE